MRILIVTAGSRGDVAPFTGLGQRLQQVGHHVALAAHERFAGLVQDAGLEHRTLPGDPVELTRARTAAPSPEAAREVFAGFLDELGDGVVAATEAGADIVLTAFGPAPLSRVVAEGFGLPSAGVYLAPGVPTREFPPPGWPAAERMSPADNLAAGREVLGRTGALYADVLRRLRARLDLGAAARTPRFRPEPVPESSSRSDSVPESRARPEIAPESRARLEAVPESRARPEAAPVSQSAEPPDDWPICHGFSPAVVPRPSDWPASVQVTGYWWPASSPGWQPPDQVLDFLRAGPPPVFVGFGSMTPEHERLQDAVAAAVKQAGVRAVVQSGWADLGPAGDDILVVDDLPHDWLFPRMAAVVHHAGAGTTGAGLRAGVPAVPVPVLVDQPFWAARLHQLGVAPRPVPMAELTAGRLADAWRSCFDAGMRARAAELGRRIRAEDGAAPVLELVARLSGASSEPS